MTGSARRSHSQVVSSSPRTMLRAQPPERPSPTAPARPDGRSNTCVAEQLVRLERGPSAAGRNVMTCRPEFEDHEPEAPIGGYEATPSLIPLGIGHRGSREGHRRQDTSAAVIAAMRSGGGVVVQPIANVETLGGSSPVSAFISRSSNRERKRTRSPGSGRRRAGVEAAPRRSMVRPRPRGASDACGNSERRRALRRRSTAR